MTPPEELAGIQEVKAAHSTGNNNNRNRGKKRPWQKK